MFVLFAVVFHPFVIIYKHLVKSITLKLNLPVHSHAYAERHTTSNNILYSLADLFLKMLIINSLKYYRWCIPVNILILGYWLMDDVFMQYAHGDMTNQEEVPGTKVS